MPTLDVVKRCCW